MQLLCLRFLTISILLPQILAHRGVPTLQEVLARVPGLSSFHNLLTTHFPELEAILSAQKQFSSFATLLAPSDDAFDRLAGSSLGPMLASNDTDTIRALLNYHTAPGNHRLSSVNESFSFFPTLLDNQTYTNVTGGQRLGFVTQGKDELIIVSGGGARSKVEQTDIAFEGGILHVTDSALVPPTPLIETAVAFNLTSFLGAVYQDESLGQLIAESNDVTLFIPHNVGMQRVGSTISSLESNDLSDVLSYHAILGKGGPFFTSSLSNGTVFQTLQSQNIAIQQASNSLFVNSARLLQTDLLIANGVIHVIDNVLNPNNTAAEPDPAVNSQPPAIAGSSLPGGETPFTDVVADLIKPSLVMSSSLATTTMDGDDATDGLRSSTGLASASTASAMETESTNDARSGRTLNCLGSISSSLILLLF